MPYLQSFIFIIMRFIERKKRVTYLLELIQKGRLLSIRSISDKFDCSDRTAKRLLDDLRDEGHPVEYDRQGKKFVIKN